jgi:3-oxoacyl-[acyl-carrier protein] reductase
MKLKNSRIILTGGSLGIGKATARLLVDAGAQVLITGRDKGRLQLASEETGARFFRADVSNPEEVKQTIERAQELFGGLDALINNAGIGGSRKELTELTVEDFQKVYAVNIYGASMMAREAAKIFKEQKHGNIINIASTASKKGYANGSVYASSKFALRGLTECWQAELRPYNVRVMLICPSEVTTAFGSENRVEREEKQNKLRSQEIAITVKAALEMDDRGFIPELTVYATNPW